MISFFKKKGFLILALMFFGAVGFYIYQRVASSQPVVKGTKSYVVKKQLIKDILTLSGEIEATEKVTLRFQSSGMLTWVGVKEGDFVKKYQGVASQDVRELERNLKKYLNTYMETRWDFETARDTNDIKNIGGLTQDAREAALRALDIAQFDLNNAVLDVELKDIALKYAYLYSPIEGIVTMVDSPYAGVYVTSTQAEFEIVNPKTIYLSAIADQTDVVNLALGMKGTITFDPYPDDKIEGTVDQIGFTPKEDETGTVYEVKIKLKDDNLSTRYRLGMTGDIDFEMGQGRKVLAIL